MVSPELRVTGRDVPVCLLPFTLPATCVYPAWMRPAHRRQTSGALVMAAFLACAVTTALPGDRASPSALAS
jgi:hypothetical protein